MKTIYSKDSKQFAYYLAGLIEGDGNIWTPKSLVSDKGRIYNPRVAFTFHYSEMPFFDKLKYIFDTGTLYREKSTDTCKYSISETKQIIDIICLINGKFRTPKIWYLHNAIDQLNTKYNLGIKKLPLDEQEINSNAWLAGFTDADGHFQIYLQGKYKNKLSDSVPRVKCFFTIKQRKIDKATGETCVPFMSKIASYFKCNILCNPLNEIKFQVQSNIYHEIVKDYFDNYPLLSSKYLDYICYTKGLNYLGKRLTDQEILDIQEIKNSMNNKRTYYNWDHLDILNKHKTTVG